MPLLHKDYNGLPIGLPEHLLCKVLDDVTPEQAMAAFSVGHHTRKFIGNNAFWERKFKRHFPHRYAEFAKNKNLGWYAAFRQTYGSEYAVFSVDNRLLFSLVKEEDVRSLRAKSITLQAFDKRDMLHFSLLAWAQRSRNQALLDYIYELACASYMAEDQMSVDVVQVDDRDRTIFYWAIACSQPLETITSLLSRGSRLDERYYVNTKPIHIAVEVDRLDIVQLFLEREPNLLDVTDNRHGTPLFWAAMRGHAEIARHLINAGANLTIVERFMRLQVIHIAALKGQLEVVRVLLEKSPHLLEQMDERGQTPLLWAARCGHADVVAYLIEKGAAIDAPTIVPVNGIDAIDVDAGKTPLCWAAERGYAEVVRLLINAGANTAATIIGPEQRRPIHTAVDNGHLDVVQALIESMPELLEQIDECGQTPLLHAARLGRADVVAYLISLGANLNVSANYLMPYSHGKTPLDWAVARGYATIAVMLLEQGAKFGLTKGLTKVIQKTGFGKVIRDKLKLAAYISKRETQPEYKKSFRLFGHTFNFGFSKTKKLAAAAALREVVFNGADRASLVQHKKVLNNGDLGAIYRRFRRR